MRDEGGDEEAMKRGWRGSRGAMRGDGRDESMNEWSRFGDE